MDHLHFRSVLGHFPTGVTAVTTIGLDGEPVGMTAGSFFSVSLDPPLVGFCAAKTSTSWPALRSAGRFCINVLAEDQESVCRQFAVKGDRFAGLDWYETEGGTPLLAGALAWIDCSLEAVHDAGDHEIVVGQVRDLSVHREAGPLVFFRGGFGRYAPGTTSSA